MSELEADKPLLQPPSPSPISATGLNFPHPKRKPPQRKSFWLAQALVLLISLSLTLYNLTLLSITPQSRNQCQKPSTFSPALAGGADDSLGAYSQTIRFNGSVFSPSPYKGDPSSSSSDPAAHAACSSLVHHGVFSITASTLVQAGARADSVPLPKAVGGGYMAMLEVFHQLHCVKALLGATYNGTPPPPPDGHKTVYRQHLDHCADILRQKLMCDGDLGVIAYNWVKGLRHPTPNFNTVHRCRDFGAIRRWAVEKTVVGRGETVGKMEGAVVLEDFP